MNIYDILNITNNDEEEAIKKAISDTKKELGNLTEETTCMIYSSYLSRNLKKEHIIHRIISTADFEYPYNHQFILIPKSSKKYYLIDLTYSQFHDSLFPKLIEDGYIVVDNSTFQSYLEIVGQDSKILSIDDVFYQDKKRIR